MSRLDDLPPDQRAVLLLLVQQGKSHAEIADTLGISAEAVRDRAHAALSALADSPLEDHHSEISGAASRARTRRARAAQSAEASPPRPSSPARASATVRSSTSLPVSRRGGALLLAALVAVVIVVIVLVTSGGGSHHGTTGTGAGTASTSSTSTTSSTSKKAKSPTVDNQFALTSPEPSSKAVGLVEVVSEKAKRAVYLAAEHLPPSTGFSYVVWLYNSPTSSEALGKAPAVSSNGRLQGGALLPADAGKYHELLLTRETSSHPTQPGPIVLSGTFALTK